MKNIRRQIPPYDSLRRMIEFFAGWTILPWDLAACDRFDQLKKERIRIGTMDLKIAAISIANGCTLLSRNLGDFEQVPELNVEDWL
jgi:tRNA(fMet)-specific endonuclease VapC